ncbi:hypothetical protein V8C35DRAFT_275362 [Trichoderma chlorosporum]
MASNWSTLLSRFNRSQSASSLEFSRSLSFTNGLDKLTTSTEDKSKPPRLTLAELKIHQENETWHDALRCVRAYHKQAASMKPADCLRMINNIKNGKYKISRTALGSPSSHLLYRHAMSRRAGPVVKVRWPDYVTLKALYPGHQLTQWYLNNVKERFGTLDIKDWSEAYYHAYPEDRVEMRKCMRVAKPYMEQSEMSSSEDESDDDDYGAEEDYEERRGGISFQLPRKRKHNDERNKKMSKKARQKLLRLMNPTIEDLDDIGPGRVLIKNGFEIILTPREVITMLAGGSPVDMELASHRSSRAETTRSKGAPESATKRAKDTAVENGEHTQSQILVAEDTLLEETQELKDTADVFDFDAVMRLMTNGSRAEQPTSPTTILPMAQENQNCATKCLGTAIEGPVKMSKIPENDQPLILAIQQALEKMGNDQKHILANQKEIQNEQIMIKKQIQEMSTKIAVLEQAQKDHQGKREKSDAQVNQFMKALATKIGA